MPWQYLVTLATLATAHPIAYCAAGRNCTVNISFDSSWTDWAMTREGAGLLEFFKLDQDSAREAARTSMIYITDACKPCEYMAQEKINAQFNRSDLDPLATDLIVITPEMMSVVGGGAYYFFCQCGLPNNFSFSMPTAALVLSGPTMTNEVSCRKGATSCTGALEGMYLGPPDVIELKLVDDSSDPCSGNSVVGGGAQLVHSPGWDASSGTLVPSVNFHMRNTTDLASASVGTYSICWCRSRNHDWWLAGLLLGATYNAYADWNATDAILSASGEWLYANYYQGTNGSNCDSVEDFGVHAGYLQLRGPHSRSASVHSLDEKLSFSLISGIGLSGSDTVWLRSQCDDNGGDNEKSAQMNMQDSSLDFGIVSTDDLLAGTYHLCWCQPYGNISCNESTHFLMTFQEVTMKCPEHWANYNGDGSCLSCGFCLDSSDDGNACVVDVIESLYAAVSILLGVLGTWMLLESVSISGGRIIGRKILIEDISRDGNSQVLTTVGNHRLVSPKATIPVTFEGTGHFQLDSSPDSCKQFRVRPLGSDTLELLDEKGNAWKSRADTSQGFLLMTAGRGVIHYGMPLPFVCPTAAVALLIICFAIILLSTLAQPSIEELVLLAVGWSLLAVVVTVLRRKLTNQKASLLDKVEKYNTRLARPEPKPCPRGPSRAITARQLMDFYEYFQAFIRDRNMYYIDPNIVRPLTAQYKLSFAERVGPHNVQWFISHWWGTAFQDTCSAIERHAKSFCKLPEQDAWMSLSYWICTFANNQHCIREELGQTHRESPFYLALHSDTCCGTCMILDQRAVPLTRSWCLFELLQTMKLETRSEHQGLVFGTSTGVLNKGDATVELALQIGHRLAVLSLKDATATTVKDQQMIESLVLKEMGTFAEIDQQLRDHVQAALRNCKHVVDDNFQGMFEHLQAKDGGMFEHQAKDEDGDLNSATAL